MVSGNPAIIQPRAVPKSNKTERFQISFDFTDAVPTTYDDASAGRSIFGIWNFSRAWNLVLGVLGSHRQL
jgi:hypothetical protein